MNKIERVCLVVIACLSIGFISANTTHAQIGIAFGPNSNRLTEVDERLRFENARGWHIEVWFDIPVGPFEMRPGLRFVSAGSIFEVADNDELDFRDDVNISMFDIPLDFRFRFNMQILTPYVALGPVLRFPTGGSGEISGMRNFNVAGGFGVGLELNLNVIMLYPELKYTFGITPFTDQEFEIAQRTFISSDNQLLNGFMVRLSIGF